MAQITKESLVVKPSSERIVDPRNALTQEYFEELVAIQESSTCPFCPGGKMIVEDRATFLFESDEWIIKPCKPQKKNTAVHLLCVPKPHITHIHNLGGMYWEKLGWALQKVLQSFEENGTPVGGGALIVREGSTELSGATVCHLHFQYIVPEMENGKPKLVQVNFGLWQGPIQS